MACRTRSALDALVSRSARALALAAVALAATATAASGADPPPKVESGPVTLRVSVWDGWGWIADAAKQFQKQHPNVTVKISDIPGDTYFTNLPRTLATGSPPDVTVLKVQPGPYEAVVKGKLLANINDVWSAQGLKSAYDPGAVKTFTAADGNHYAVNQGRWWNAVWVNSDAFKKAGLKPPSGGHITSQAELYRYSAALTKAGYIPLIADVNGDGAFAGVWILQSLIQTGCGAATINKLLTTGLKSGAPTSTWTQPCVVKALTQLGDYAKKGVLGKSPGARTASQAYALFSTGKGGMYITGSWMSQGIEIDKAANKPSFNYSWTLLPPLAGGKAPMIFRNDADGVGIPARSKHIGTAKAFLSLLASKKFAASLNTFIGGFPGVQGRKDVPVPSNVTQTVRAQYAAMNKGGNLTDLSNGVSFSTALPVPLAALISGQKNAQDTAKALQALADQARANG